MPMPQERIYTSEDYWNLPEGQRAELIDGKLYAMAPPNRILMTNGKFYIVKEDAEEIIAKTIEYNGKVHGYHFDHSDR